MLFSLILAESPPLPVPQSLSGNVVLSAILALIWTACRSTRFAVCGLGHRRQLFECLYLCIYLYSAGLCSRSCILAKQHVMRKW